MDIKDITSINIDVLNSIEWWIGRSICKRDNPDCELVSSHTNWVKPVFDKCPYACNCLAYNTDKKLLHANEPQNKGTSY